MIQIKVKQNEKGKYESRRCDDKNEWLFARIGFGSTIQEAIEDFLKINKLQNETYKWS
jgi:hypothetical protein